MFSYQLMFILNAIVAVALGVGFLIVPATMLDFFGAETRVPELLLARFFGSTMITIGLLLWFAKDVDETVQRWMAISLIAGAVFGLIVTLFGVSRASGVIRSNGWLAILLYVLFALGYAFLAFLQPRLSRDE